MTTTANASAENALAADLFRPLPARYDMLAEILSLRQNRRWRLELVRHVAASEPRSVLDVATGTAGVAIELTQQTRAAVTGIDISTAMLRRGNDRVKQLGLESRIQLREGRAEALPFADASFDAISFTYLLRYVQDPAATLAEMSRVLRPGGVMSSLDFFLPPSPVWRAAWWLYTRAVLPLAGFLLGGRAWWAVGRFLGPNISGHYQRWPLSRIVEAWHAAGMIDVEHHVMSAGGGLVMWGRKGNA